MNDTWVLNQTNMDAIWLGWLGFGSVPLVMSFYRDFCVRNRKIHQLQKQTVSMSAPGKALVAGGYLVLDNSIGVTVASTSRFYSTVKVIHSQTRSDQSKYLLILVESPQFYSIYTFEYNLLTHDLRLVSDLKNDFIEKCLQLFFSFAMVHFGAAGLKNILVAIAAEGQLRIKLRADNDFYSQISHLRSLNKPFLSSSLRELPPFLPCPRDPTSQTAVVVKTGTLQPRHHSFLSSGLCRYGQFGCLDNCTDWVVVAVFLDH
jgi:hypothetical protein